MATDVGASASRALEGRAPCLQLHDGSPGCRCRLPLRLAEGTVRFSARLLSLPTVSDRACLLLSRRGGVALEVNAFAQRRGTSVWLHAYEAVVVYAGAPNQREEWSIRGSEDTDPVHR